MIRFLYSISLIISMSVHCLADENSNGIFHKNIEDLYVRFEECGAPKDVDNRILLSLSINNAAERLRDEESFGVSYSSARQKMISRMYTMLEIGSHQCEIYGDIEAGQEEKFADSIQAHAILAFIEVVNEISAAD